MTFSDIGIAPWDVNTVLGKALWEDCWGSRHGGITLQHYVPLAMQHLLAYLISDLAPPEVRHVKYEAAGKQMWKDACTREDAALKKAEEDAEADL